VTSAASTSGTVAAKKNIDRIRAYYDAVNRFDFDAIGSMLGDTVVTAIPGDSPYTGRYQGRDALLKLYAKVQHDSSGTFHIELIHLLANDSTVVTLHRLTASRNGRSLDQANFNLYTFDSTGRIIERWEYPEDIEAHDVFWRD
jgi:ketosteroid isomerase-like protein